MRSEHRSDNPILNRRKQRVFQSESPVKDKDKFLNNESDYKQNESNCNSTKNQCRYYSDKEESRFPSIYVNKPNTANHVKTSNESLKKMAEHANLNEK